MKKSRLKRLPSLIRLVLWVLLVQLLLINISAAFYAYKLTYFYQDPALRDTRSNKNILVKTWKLFTGPRQPRPVITQSPTFKYQTIILATTKELAIECWYAPVDTLPKGTVILFHGINANKGKVISEANEFRFQGFNVLMVDFRGHGNSSGRTTTIGVRESEEVKLAYDFISGLGEKNIFLWGSSMGAVVIAKAIAKYNLQPAGAILEMPFASMQSYLRSRARAIGFNGFPEKPFGFFVTAWISIERGINGYRHKTDSYAKKIHCPLLLQWGSRDTYVLKNETDKIFDAIASPRKKLVIYELSGHQSLLEKETEKWRREVGEFLDSKSK